MWLPIIANFFNFILVIFGFFGAYQYKTKYIVIVSITRAETLFAVLSEMLIVEISLDLYVCGVHFT